ncbi:MAG: aminotransferase class I/II-fold pyridoxal phosphate-dependent enzyme, partial [Trueperaceae bacterium]
TSGRMTEVLAAMKPFMRFFETSTWARRRFEPGISDFAIGNPHEMPLPGFVSALQRQVQPQNKDWFAYKTSEAEARAVIAASLCERRGLPFEEEDIQLTNGCTGAIAVSLCTLLDPGDEVIFNSPPWFFYEAYITAYGGKPVRVKVDPENYDLDISAIEQAITERTRAIIVNSPNNPTGKIYPPETLHRLSQVLTAASERNGRTIYLLSDEAYSRIIFDDRDYPSPTAFYPNSLLLYTYGKTLLTPGQRLGYIALPPTMPDREGLRRALFAAQIVVGFAFPNALMQYALDDLEKLSLDIDHLQVRRDRMVGALRGMGYELYVPEGTFYVMVWTPIEDDVAFSEILAEYDVFVLPGSVVELPGTFRLSLTANDEMVERSLPGFEAAMKGVGVTAR